MLNDDMKSVSENEQVGALIRAEYLDLPEDLRTKFREWVASLALTANSPASVGVGWVSVHLSVRADVDGEKIVVAVSPNMLARAISAWDRGEEYITGSFEP